MKCSLCPRLCGADRQAGQRGVCGADHEMRVSRVMLHPWEEPCLGGSAGTVFFSGCSLGCVYCQNKAISRPQNGVLPGEIRDEAWLSEEMLSLQSRGATCIDLVTPTHYADRILTAVASVKDRLEIPVVWNTGGYETPETVRRCRGLVDIFLTDFKYGTAEAAETCSHAPDYPAVAAAALAEMFALVGAPVWENDRLRSGIVLRHLVLPGGRKDSIAALRLAAQAVVPSSVILSLMRQYTPDFAPPEMKNLRRRITSFEYDSVLAEAVALGFDGYTQEKSSASAAYTPDF